MRQKKYTVKVHPYMKTRAISILAAKILVLLKSSGLQKAESTVYYHGISRTLLKFYGNYHKHCVKNLSISGIIDFINITRNMFVQLIRIKSNTIQRTIK